MTTKVKKAVNKLPYVAALFFGINFIGAVLFMLIESVNFIDSVYWSFITSLSVGYGDISPVTVAGKILAIVMAASVLLVVVPLLVGIFVSNAIEDPNEFDHTEQERMEAKLNILLAQHDISVDEFNATWQDWCDKE